MSSDARYFFRYFLNESSELLIFASSHRKFSSEKIFAGENISMKIAENRSKSSLIIQEISQISLKISLNVLYISHFSEKIILFSELKNPTLIRNYFMYCLSITLEIHKNFRFSELIFSLIYLRFFKKLKCSNNCSNKCSKVCRTNQRSQRNSTEFLKCNKSSLRFSC